MMVDRGMAVRAMSLYGPMAVAGILHLGRRPHRRMGAAVLLGVLWTMPALLALQRVNMLLGWWSFQTAGPVIRGVPVELYLGWCCLWGAVPVLAFRRLPIAWIVMAMVLLDGLVMPLSGAVVGLQRSWWIGEGVAALTVLTPGVLLARWTLDDRRLGWRAVLQVGTAGGVFLYLPPEIYFAVRGGGWNGIGLHGWRLAVALQVIAVLALPGVSAVQEFVERGVGTPIPYDPPRRLVTSGIYRYVANPMQIGCTLVLFAWGWLLGSWWLAAAGLLSWMYCVGLARWDEGQHLQRRFGGAWIAYRQQVTDWRIRWRPFTAEMEARLYVAEGCTVCREVSRWFESRHVSGLAVCAAEEYPGGRLRRMRYVPGDGTPPEDGIRALARGLEHLHLGWVFVGMAMRLPILRAGIQMLADGVGFGERDLPVKKVEAAAERLSRSASSR